MAAAPAQEGVSVSLDDIYHILFRHKLKIILCAMLGLGGGAAAYVLTKSPFTSDAKLFVRYVVTEGGPRSAENESVKSPDRSGETIMPSEQEIIQSLDLAKDVAKVIGPEKLMAKYGGGDDLNMAALVVRRGLFVDAPRYGSVITLSFQHPDVDLVQPVLREVITQYFKKHNEIHRSSGLDYLTMETDQLRARLAATEDDLRRAISKAGVVSIAEAKKTNSDQMAAIRAQIFATEAELAEKMSVLQDYAKSVNKGVKEPVEPAEKTAKDLAAPDVSATAKTAAAEPTAVAATPVAVAAAELTREIQDSYRATAARLDALIRREQDLLLTFTRETPRVQEIHAQIVEVQAKKQEMEATYPRLISAPVAVAAAPGQPARTPADDASAELVRINSLRAKVKALNSQMDILRRESESLGQVEGTIVDLMRRKELEDASYRRYAANLEQIRINEALGAGKVTNITQIQTPSPPALAIKSSFKVPGGVAVGGLALGLGWAFLFELVLDRSLRRPTEIEKKLRVPLFLSIPDLNGKRPGWFRRLRDRRKRPSKSADGTAITTAQSEALQAGPNSPAALALAEKLQPFHETLRDRLISYCESQNLSRKPKLIAVTGLGRESGVTTIAAGLAQSLSETGEGNVLLVDLTTGQGSAMQFLKGSASVGLDELLDSKNNAQVQQNLFVVTDSNSSEQLSRNLPRRFTRLIPKLKASDFDYVIFDMPPVSQLSITPRLAGFMDVVLFVVESEKTNTDTAQQAAALLAKSTGHLGAVLNKTKTYVPAWLHQEYPSTA